MTVLSAVVSSASATPHCLAAAAISMDLRVLFMGVGADVRADYRTPMRQHDVSRVNIRLRRGHAPVAEMCQTRDTGRRNGDYPTIPAKPAKMSAFRGAQPSSARTKPVATIRFGCVRPPFATRGPAGAEASKTGAD